MNNLEDVLEKEDEKSECYEYRLLKESDLAILARIKNKNIWLPKSQIEYDDKYVWVPFWLAEKHRLL